MNAAKTSASILVLVSVACGGGGGGGGGGGSPTTPPPPGVSVTVVGSVEGFQDPGSNFQGSQVEITGAGTATIGADNRFRVDGVPVGVQQLTITGPNHLNRRVDINVQQGGTNRFNTLDLVESSGFNLAAFDEIYREDYDGPRTVRWVRRPTRVVIDRGSLASLPQGLAFFENRIRSAYATWLPANTNGFFAGTPVQLRNFSQVPDPEDDGCLSVPDGEIHIFGVDECPSDGNFITLGLESHCWRIDGENNVAAAAIYFNPCTTDSTIDHEIIHTLCASHLETVGGNSIMTPITMPGDAITGMDRRHMQYLYSRPSGVMTPDDSVGLGALQPTVG